MVADREYPCWRWGRYPMVHHCREKAVRPGLSRGTRLGFILPLTIQDPEPYKTRNHTRPVAPCRHGPMGDGNPGPRRTPGSNSRPAPGPKLWAKTLGQNSDQRPDTPTLRLPRFHGIMLYALSSPGCAVTLGFQAQGLMALPLTLEIMNPNL